MGSDDQRMEKDNEKNIEEAGRTPEELLFVQYRGKCTEEYGMATRKIKTTTIIEATSREDAEK